MEQRLHNRPAEGNTEAKGVGSMRSRKMLAAAALTLAAAALLLARPAKTPEEDRSVQTAGLPAEQTRQAHPAEQTACWTVGLWQGHIAVFHQGAEAPETVLEMPVDALPEADRAALERGIPVNTPEELAALLEDYGS